MYSGRLSSVKIKKTVEKKRKKNVLKKYNVKNFEILITLSFGIFLSRHLQSPITHKVLEIEEKFFLLFKADEISFNIKYSSGRN